MHAQETADDGEHDSKRPAPAQENLLRGQVMDHTHGEVLSFRLCSSVLLPSLLGILWQKSGCTLRTGLTHICWIDPDTSAIGRDSMPSLVCCRRVGGCSAPAASNGGSFAIQIPCDYLRRFYLSLVIGTHTGSILRLLPAPVVSSPQIRRFREPKLTRPQEPRGGAGPVSGLNDPEAIPPPHAADFRSSCMRGLVGRLSVGSPV